jgi:hypothetical protein
MEGLQLWDHHKYHPNHLYTPNHHCNARIHKTEETIAAAIVLILRKHRKKQHICVIEGDLGIAMRHQEEIGWNNFVLGRWSVKWGEAQHRHYERIGSKRTSKRRATAILHKLAMIRCDLWEFRNGILHTPTGPLAVAKHAFLNSLIGKDFTRGKDGIDKYYYYLFEGDNTLNNLQASNITTKEQWLQTLLSARQDYEPPEAVITKESRLQRQMHKYLVNIGDKILESLASGTNAVTSRYLNTTAQFGSCHQASHTQSQLTQLVYNIA